MIFLKKDVVVPHPYVVFLVVIALIVAMLVGQVFSGGRVADAPCFLVEQIQRAWLGGVYLFCVFLRYTPPAVGGVYLFCLVF